MLQAFSGGNIFGERYGIGPPSVLAMHGWARTRQDFAAVLDGHDAIALDLPGFGASPEPQQVAGAAGYAEMVAPILDELAGPVIVVGHSFGGRIAVNLAARHPDRIRAVVLTGVPLVRPAGYTPPTPSARYRAAKWLNEHKLLSDGAMEKRRRKHGSADYRNARGVMRDVLVTVVNETYEAELPRLRGRVELVWGELDDVSPVAVLRAAVPLLIGAEVVHEEIVPAGSHYLPTKTPAPLRAAIERCERWSRPS